jgi:FKBP-type peptidyl-prolyl cis-trans isomerase FklB
MKKIIVFALITVFMAAAASQASALNKDKKKKKGKKETVCTAPGFTTNTDTVSYIIGCDIAHNFAKNELDVNRDMVFKGFMDAQAKSDTLFTQEQIEKVMTAWQMEMAAKKKAKTDSESSKNEKLGEEFLATNKTKEGVIELPSGLQYKVIKEGSGESPDDNDMVEVHYTGTLIDGTVFDSSRERGEPLEFPVNGVIPGWTEALKLMKPGAQYMLYIPSKLAYGKQATGPIPAGSTLIFDVELLEFEKK